VKFLAYLLFALLLSFSLIASAYIYCRYNRYFIQPSRQGLSYKIDKKTADANSARNLPTSIFRPSHRAYMANLAVNSRKYGSLSLSDIMQFTSRWPLYLKRLKKGSIFLKVSLYIFGSVFFQQANGEVELLVSVELANGPRFEGTDVIRVIDKAGKKKN